MYSLAVLIKLIGKYIIYCEARQYIKAHLSKVTHDVVESGEEAAACSNLWVHGAIYVVKQVQCLTRQLIALLYETLLDLVLATGKYMVGICCLAKNILFISYEIQ